MQRPSGCSSAAGVETEMWPAGTKGQTGRLKGAGKVGGLQEVSLQHVVKEKVSFDITELYVHIYSTELYIYIYDRKRENG